MDQIELKHFCEPSDSHLVGELTDLLHKAYRPLALRGMNYKASYQNESDTLRRLRKGPSFLAFLSQKLVGTITLVIDDPEETCEWYRRPDVFNFEQFAVDPDFQKLGVGKLLYYEIEAYARAHGATELALDTSEFALDLIEYYSRLGFRFIQFERWSETNYRSVIMSKHLG